MEDTPMKNKNKNTLESNELKIVRLLQEKDENTTLAFNLVRMHYLVEDEKKHCNHSKLIDRIYINRPNATKWAVANDCNIGERTAFRYKREYLNLIKGFSAKINQKK